jgi:hypothetical protein
VIAELARFFSASRIRLDISPRAGRSPISKSLWVARQLAPGKVIAFSRESHYTHRRMCEVLGVEGLEIAADSSSQPRAGGSASPSGRSRQDRDGRRDPWHDRCRGGRSYWPIFWSCAASSTFRIHIDAAYGGFFRLLAETPGLLDPADAQSLPVDS